MGTLATDVADLSKSYSDLGDGRVDIRATVGELTRAGVPEKDIKAILTKLYTAVSDDMMDGDQDSKAALVDPRDFVSASKLLGMSAASEEFLDQVQNLRRKGLDNDMSEAETLSSLVKFIANPAMVQFVAAKQQDDATTSTLFILENVLSDNTAKSEFGKFATASGFMGAPVAAVAPDQTLNQSATGASGKVETTTAIATLSRFIDMAPDLKNDRAMEHSTAVIQRHNLTQEQVQSILALREDSKFGERLKEIPVAGLLTLGACGLDQAEMAKGLAIDKTAQKLPSGLRLAEYIDTAGLSSSEAHMIENHPLAVHGKLMIDTLKAFSLEGKNKLHISALQAVGKSIFSKDRNITSLNAAFEYMIAHRNEFVEPIWNRINKLD